MKTPCILCGPTCRCVPGMRLIPITARDDKAVAEARKAAGMAKTSQVPNRG